MQFHPLASTPLLMGLSAMHPFVGLAKRANMGLHLFDNGEGHALPALPCMVADGAELAQAGQPAVQGGNLWSTHDFSAFPTVYALPRRGPTLWYPLWAVS